MTQEQEPREIPLNELPPLPSPSAKEDDLQQAPQGLLAIVAGVAVTLLVFTVVELLYFIHSWVKNPLSGLYDILIPLTPLYIILQIFLVVMLLRMKPVARTITRRYLLIRGILDTFKALILCGYATNSGDSSRVWTICILLILQLSLYITGLSLASKHLSEFGVIGERVSSW